VRPLTAAEVQATTDLLTEVFATLGGPGWNVYTRYMRNQIHKFLEVRVVALRPGRDECPR